MQYYTSLERMSQRSTTEYILNSGHAEHAFAEWQPISVGYVWHDWMQTGNTTLPATWFDMLRNYTLLDLVDPSVGLVNVSSLPNPEIDWPANMRDGFVFSTFNTIVNAYAVRAMRQVPPTQPTHTHT
jgi:alpha-L-rhamnosidase